jgi:hypothetical protein
VFASGLAARGSSLSTPRFTDIANKKGVSPEENAFFMPERAGALIVKSRYF